MKEECPWPKTLTQPWNIQNEKPVKEARRKLERKAVPAKDADDDDKMEIVDDSGRGDDSGSLNRACGSKETDFLCNFCCEKDDMRKSLNDTVANLTLDVSTLEKERIDLDIKVDEQNRKSKGFTASRIESDSRIQFFTGTQTVAAFTIILGIISPFLSNFIYWRRGKRHLKDCKERPVSASFDYIEIEFVELPVA